MAETTLVYTPRFAEYDFGPGHPMRPVRVQRTYELIRACGLLERPHVSLEAPPMASEETLSLVHHRKYIGAVRRPRDGEYSHQALDFGLGTIDNPIVEGMYEASAIVVGGSVFAADRVIDGAASAAFNPSGGLHHARRARAAGFCIFNDAAVAIAHLLKRCGKEVKVAYVDIDAHHGDGVQEAFYRQRNVLTISVHESGRYLYPGTGYVEEIGEGKGTGFCVNLPLAPYTTDDTYLFAFREIVCPLLEAYAPDFVCTQLGIDTHYRDPLTHMCLTTRGYVAVVDEIAQRAGRWIALGGGGYEMTVVPRAWTLAFARMTETEPPEEIPPSEAAHYPGGEGVKLHDSGDAGVSEDLSAAAREFAEKTVQSVKQFVFPYHGLPT